MQIVHLTTNWSGYPTLRSWVPVTLMSTIEGMGVQLGRPNDEGAFPLNLWLDITADGPEVQWSWKRNWFRPFVTEAEPQSFGEVTDVLALVRKSEEDFSSDAVLLLVDLHSGKKPHKDLAEESKGGFLAKNHEAARVYTLTQQDHYPVGMMVIYPGFQAWVRAEALFATHTLVYPSVERGVYLMSNNPVIASGPSVAGHYHGYGWSSAAAAITRQHTDDDIGPFKI